MLRAGMSDLSFYQHVPHPTWWVVLGLRRGQAQHAPFGLDVCRTAGADGPGGLPLRIRTGHCCSSGITSIPRVVSGDRPSR